MNRRILFGALALFAVALPFTLGAVSGCQAPQVGLTTEGALTPCPDRPNCVSSQEQRDSHQINPIAFSGDPAAAWDRLHETIRAFPRTTIVSESDNYLHVVCRSFLFRFADDVEFLLDGANSVIHVRSASRVGYSDLGANRKRIEKLRAAFQTRRP